MVEAGFTYRDGVDTAPIEGGDLIKYLSMGERRAFYILNVLFEVDPTRKDGQEPLIVIDDIADSFDYKKQVRPNPLSQGDFRNRTF